MRNSLDVSVWDPGSILQRKRKSELQHTILSNIFQLGWFPLSNIYSLHSKFNTLLKPVPFLEQQPLPLPASFSISKQHE